MPKLVLGELFLFPMPSGDHGIFLKEDVPWDGLSQFASAFADALHANISSEQDSYSERTIEATIDGESFALVYDKWSSEVSLEPRSTTAAALIVTLLERLKRLRIDQPTTRGQQG